MNSSALFAKLTNRFPGIIQMVAINQSNPSLLINSNLSYSRLAVLIKPLFITHNDRGPGQEEQTMECPLARNPVSKQKAVAPRGCEIQYTRYARVPLTPDRRPRLFCRSRDKLQYALDS